MISRGFAGGGETSSARKKYVKAIREKEVMGVEQLVKKTKVEDVPITFTEEEALELSHPHDDPLVISAVIANFQIWRILVDSGSSADILYWKAFEKMSIGKEKLHPVISPLVGFAGDRVEPIGSITLPVTLGTELSQATKMVNFLVVDCPSAYNAILGRGSLNQFRAVASTYHLLLKFPTERGIGMAKGNQRAARECYASSIKDTCREALIVEELEVRDEEEVRRGEPGDDLEEVMIGGQDPSKTVRIGASASPSQKEELIQFLVKNSDVFAWSHKDMPGIDAKVMVHRLNIFPGARPVKQK